MVFRAKALDNDTYKIKYDLVESKQDYYIVDAAYDLEFNDWFNINIKSGGTNDNFIPKNQNVTA